MHHEMRWRHALRPDRHHVAGDRLGSVEQIGASEGVSVIAGIALSFFSIIAVKKSSAFPSSTVLITNCAGSSAGSPGLRVADPRQAGCACRIAVVIWADQVDGRSGLTLRPAKNKKAAPPWEGPKSKDDTPTGEIS
jgi:hypothetical protein